MSRTDRPARWFRGDRWRTRAHVALRWTTGPFGPVADLVPPGATVLDWGCGHGLLGLALADRDPDVRVVGVDIDAAKVAAAARAIEAAGLGERISVRTVEPDDLPEGPVDVVVLDDVLYLMAPDRQERLVRAAAAALAPGGAVVCKEMAATPRWKARLVTWQERVTVGRLSVSATADGLGAFPPPARVATWLAEEGLVTEVVAIDRRYHSPHVAVIGRRDGRLHA